MNFLDRKQKSFLLNWYLATVIGMIAGSTISLDFHSAWTPFMINLNWVTATGLFISLTQWFVLQQLVPVKWWWLTSLLGFLLAAIISGLVLQMTHGPSLTNQLHRTVYNFFEGAIIGFCAGLIQWLSIRHFFTDFKSWILASLLAWSLGLMVDRFQTYSLFASLHIAVSIRWMLHTLLSCIPIAGFTGFVLLKLQKLLAEKDIE
jgi:hypothetical protein